MNNPTIKKKQLVFKHNSIEFSVKIKYDTTPFGIGDNSFWHTKLYKVDDKKLTIPITYNFIQSRGWLLQIPKFRIHHYYCSSSRKKIENQINLYPLVKEQIIYQWFNRKSIFKYQARINNFNFLVEQKYQHKLKPLREQKRELKQKLRHGVIDNKQYQKLYTPIRKLINDVEFNIWNICYTYNKRYFDYSDKLKEIYRVD